MSAYTLTQGQRYGATIGLGLLERIASNEIVASKLRDAGFIEVTVMGTGAHRTASGVWNLPTASVDLPEQIKEVRSA